MAKIVFVNLYDFTYIRKSQTPLGILSLYILLNKKTDWDVEICDFNKIYYNKILVEEDFIKNIYNMADYIINMNPDIISIYTMCDIYHIALLVSKEIKHRAPHINIILAGPHATMVAKETLEQIEYIDYIGLGEGERTIIPLLNGVIHKQLDDVTGIGYRDQDGNAIIRWDRFKAYDVEKLDLLNLETVGEFFGDIREVHIEGGRGCPFRCAYCSTQIFWGNNFRVKSIKK